MAKAKDLAGLAALGALGYMLSKDKGGDSNPTRAARPESTETRKDEGPTADKKTKKDVLEAITKPKEKANDAAGNQGVLGGNKPASKSMPKVETKADADAKTATTSTRTTSGGNEKRTEGNQPMPSLRAVEARAASNKTDEMRNVSRAQQAGINRQKAMRANPESQALEESHPEQFLTPGGGFKTVANMAKNLANRGGKEVVEYSTPRLAAPAKQLTGPSKADLVARDRAARASSRQEEMLKENAANYGLNPKAPGYDAAASSLRKNIGGEDFTIMKRGGMTKMASGGMTASRRADGIATRGKTKCKMY
jgi:hypothetical protein